MVPLPLLPLEEDGEEDEGEGGKDASPSSSHSHPHLLARRFLDFGAHGAQRFLQQDPDATSPTKAQRYDEARTSSVAARFYLWIFFWSFFLSRVGLFWYFCCSSFILVYPAVLRPRRASFGSKEAMRGGDSVTHQLTKKLQHLKKKIKQFEEQFEKERNYKVTIKNDCRICYTDCSYY